MIRGLDPELEWVKVEPADSLALTLGWDGGWAQGYTGAGPGTRAPGRV